MIYACSEAQRRPSTLCYAGLMFTRHTRILLLGLACLSVACSESQAPPVTAAAEATTTAARPNDVADYVGSEACASCHVTQFTAWRNSHHDLALQPASDSSVLAAFGPGAATAPFKREDIAFVFGVAPLQQYLIASDGGRLQSHPTAWDSRPSAAGGQRWFDLYDSNLPPDDPMHWTGRANTWNATCADCHSTGVVKNYNARTNSYETTWELEDVACEACHGPASIHAETHAGQVPAADKVPAAAMLDLSNQNSQINACAPCHSRRSQLAEGFQPGKEFLDYYSPALLMPDLYHVDGQISDEVYVYGSFLQSKMHQRGVTCTNCHDPHSATLKLPGNAVCTQCHQIPAREEFPTLRAAVYDTPEHHFHPMDSTGAACVACHMVATRYMGVDDRRDHSLRIPRPDLAQSLGVPDACTGCHEDRDPAWASAVITSHFGDEHPSHYGSAFRAAGEASATADADLAALAGDTGTPIMVRATALAYLGSYSRGYTLDAVREGLKGDGLLRMGAIQGTSSLSPQARWRLVAPLLDDELRAVRDEAFLNLLPLAALDPQYRDRLRPHFEQYLKNQSGNLDFPEMLTNIAGAQLAFGDRTTAESTLENALELQSTWVPALLNLADIYRETGRDEQGGPLIVRALDAAPYSADAAYVYALWLSRQSQHDESFDYFEQANSLDPDNLRYAYAFALALNDFKQADRAIESLLSLTRRWPASEEILFALVTMLRDAGRIDEALTYLDQLIVLRPEDDNLLQFRQILAAAGATS